MRIVYTDEALRDLDEILDFITAHYPAIASSFQQRLQTVLQCIGKWPKSAEEVEQRPGVRVVPLIRYPYKIFYQATA
jgi:toxin ParE1/3/4